MIPKRRGLLYPQPAAPMIKSLAAFADIRSSGSLGDCLAGISPPNWKPVRHRKLGPMTRYSTPQNDFQIDRIHNGAVCTEIGERLSIALGPQSIELQPRLGSLMKQLSEQA